MCLPRSQLAQSTAELQCRACQYLGQQGYFPFSGFKSAATVLQYDILDLIGFNLKYHGNHVAMDLVSKIIHRHLSIIVGI